MDHDPRYWHSRGYLPHFDQDGFTQFITFRLYDSVPQTVLDKWRLDLKNGEIKDADFRRRVEYYLDQNYGEGFLIRPLIGRLVEEALLKWDGERYRLIAWVIMPNHVHLLFSSLAAHTVANIMHSIKSYTSHAANKLLDRSGHFWAREYYDRYIRDSRHFASTIAYIENNPVKARLCAKPEDWPFGSAGLRRK